MNFYVYIIANTTDDDFYTGFTENPLQTLADHNEGWYFVFLKNFETKRDALIYEKKIKRLNKRSLLQLIDSAENILESYMKG